MNKKWRTHLGEFFVGGHSLYFTPEDEALRVAIITVRKGNCWYVSNVLANDERFVRKFEVNTLEDAKKKIEELIANRYKTKIAYYKNLYEKFIE